ncbi:odorant receptor 49a-like [Harpegnathos saltator]|uniref:odorant receptor 49a-like n=1 Tax=Harpegnathos saltator TaxID=610380 RepID=UPI000DBED843|nr:odorant receptor 49a-like [Harpegnathos saltator]
MSKLNACFFFLIISATISTSLNLLWIFHELTTKCDFEKLVTPILILITLYVYMFLSNYCGQIVIDHNEEVFTTLYSIQWYCAPLRIQKIILFLLQKGTKTFHMNIGGLFVASLKGFSTLASTSTSYFTIIYSTMM